MNLRLFEMARKYSFKSPSRFRLGCVIADKHRLVKAGYNNMAKTHPKMPSMFKALHAEVHALLGLSYEQTKKAVAYVYREDKNGAMADAKPCGACEQALRIAGIKTVYYTCRTGIQGMAL